MKTFKELVTELKASTLGSYIKKASKDANDLAYIQGAAGSLNAPFERKKKHQRERGIETATDKLVKGKVTKEETEELDELKASTLGSYVKKASVSAANHALWGGAKGDDEENEKVRTRLLTKADKRLKGIAKASDKLSKGQVTKEEIEELDELSKKTLGSYIKKASGDAKYRAYNAGADDWGNGEDQKHPSRRTWPGRKDDDKAHQRLKGIATATDKLTKEETEELDELKRNTLDSYAKKASFSRHANHEKLMRNLDGSPNTISPENRAKAERKIANRTAGIKNAEDRIIGNRYTKEETELDETSHVSKANIDEGTFDYHLKKAQDSHERGDRKRTEYHLNNAKHARFGLSSTEIVRKADKLNQYHKLATEYETKNEELEEARQKQEIKQAPHEISTDTLKRPLTRKEMSSDESKAFMSKLHPGSTHGLEQHQNPNYKGKTVDHVWRNEKGEMIGFQGKNSKRLWHHDPKAYDATAKKESRDLDARIAEIVEKRALEIENIQYIDEVLTKSDPAEKWIHDFVHSENPKFAGKSKSERRQMALGAYYGKQKEKNEEIVSEERGWKEKEGGHHKTQGGARVAIKKYGNSWESTYYKDGISQDGGANHPNVNVLKAKANIWLNKNKD